MASIPNGVYTLGKFQEQALTLFGGLSEPRTQAVVLPDERRAEQQWQLESTGSNGTVTIKNIMGGSFLGHDGDPNVNEMVFGYGQPREWELRPTERGRFHIVVPGGPVDGSELVLDLSLLRIYPPMVALRPLQAENVDQTWMFQPRE
jgi:hypothetical protein